MKRGFVFSLDAIIVLGLVFTLALFLSALSFSYSSPELKYQRLYYSAKDLINVLEQAKLSSVGDSPLVQGYLSSGVITEEDMDKTILDAIGSFWAEGNMTEAGNLANLTFSRILNGSGLDYQLMIDGQNIFVKNTTEASFLAKLSLIVSGYETGKPVSGYSARTRLSKANRISTYYVYFGGYIGDGNISADFTLPEFDNILSSSMEMSTGNNFSLYINGNYSGDYGRNFIGDMRADSWAISNGYLQYFVMGNNTIQINFTSNQSMYIGGGYLKITYNTSQLTDSGEAYGENATKTEYLPGIDGLINIYSSFYVPGSLKNISAHLHFRSNYTVFMTIGNITVYEGNSSGGETVDLDSSYLSGLLDYSFMSNKTVPYRVGLVNVSYVSSGLGIGDSVVVTDVSGSMNDCAIWGKAPYCHYDCRKRFIFCYNSYMECAFNATLGCSTPVCGTCGCGTYSNYYVYDKDVCNMTKLDVAKGADKEFVGIVLNDSYPGNRVGLVSYSTAVNSYVNLTTNKTLLNSSIEGYTSGGNTCICCGIIRAANMTRDLSSQSRRKSVVIMTDGEANVRCNNANSDIDGDSDIDAKDDTIKAACDAYTVYNITVYTIGFGETEADVDNGTLSRTAVCGGGKYYYSNVTELAQTFREIAREVVNASYVAQTIEVSGISNTTALFKDSYIRLDYSSSIKPAGYGEVELTFETQKISNISGPGNITDPATKTKEAWYYIPENMEVVDAKITSYSSNFWTDRLYVNSSVTSDWMRIFWLGDYELDYISLGDPFIVNIPVSYVGVGNNSVKIGTGLNSTEGKGASPDDRVVYTLKVDGIFLEGYSDVFPKAKGASVRIYYDWDGDNNYDGYSDVSYGPDPSDIFDPQNDSVDDSFMRLMDVMNFIYDLSPSSYGNGSLENPYDGINQTNPVDLQITSNVQFDTVTASGIPSLWGPAEMEIRIWS